MHRVEIRTHTHTHTILFWILDNTCISITCFFKAKLLVYTVNVWSTKTAKFSFQRGYFYNPFSNYWSANYTGKKERKKVKVSHIQLFVTPWTVACQVSLSMGFSRQEYWSRLLFLLQRIFPTQGSSPGLLHCRRTLYQLSYMGSHSGSIPGLGSSPGEGANHSSILGLPWWLRQ